MCYIKGYIIYMELFGGLPYINYLVGAEAGAEKRYYQHRQDRQSYPL